MSFLEMNPPELPYESINIPYDEDEDLDEEEEDD